MNCSSIFDVLDTTARPHVHKSSSPPSPPIPPRFGRLEHNFQNNRQLRTKSINSLVNQMHRTTINRLHLFDIKFHSEKFRRVFHITRLITWLVLLLFCTQPVHGLSDYHHSDLMPSVDQYTSVDNHDDDHLLRASNQSIATTAITTNAATINTSITVTDYWASIQRKWAQSDCPCRCELDDQHRKVIMCDHQSTHVHSIPSDLDSSVQVGSD